MLGWTSQLSPHNSELLSRQHSTYSKTASRRGVATCVLQRHLNVHRCIQRRICCSAVHGAEPYCIPPPPGVQNAEHIPWKDSATDVAFIGMCRKAYGNLAGCQSDADWQDGAESYRGMIEVSRALMKVIGLVAADDHMPHSRCKQRNVMVFAPFRTFGWRMQGKTAHQQRDAVIAGFPQVLYCALVHRCVQIHLACASACRIIRCSRSQCTCARRCRPGSGACSRTASGAPS